MIDHTGIRVTRLLESKRFYVSSLAALGYRVCLELEDSIGFGAQQTAYDDDPGGDFWLIRGNPYVPRSHVAFRAQNEEQVDLFYREALAAGGKDNGQPGLRPKYHPGYYAAFILDPDGYNIEAVFHRGHPADAP